MIIKECPNCNYENTINSSFCGLCQRDIKEIEGSESKIKRIHNSDIYPPNNASEQYRYPYVAPSEPLNFYHFVSILGFVCSMLGIFVFAVVLLPIAIIASAIGFVKKQLNGLAIAGLIISIVALVIKIFVLLDRYEVIPYWMTRGIF